MYQRTSHHNAKELSSIYTFNSITCMCYLDDEFSVVIGTEGGKLEIWHLIENKKLDSAFAHGASITAVKAVNTNVYSAAMDGAVKVWVFEDGELQPLYSRKRTETSMYGINLGPTLWKTLSVANDVIYLGDCTSHLKAMHWRLGQLALYVNQVERNGVCEAVFAEDNILLSSSYDKSTDTAAINVWSLPDMVYIGTLTGDIQDICCLTLIRLEDRLRIVSGGHQLVVWDFNLKEPSKEGPNAKFRFTEVEGIGVEFKEESVKPQSPAQRAPYYYSKTEDIQGKQKQRQCTII